MTRKITIFLLFAVLIILGLWDIYAATNMQLGDTISEVVLVAAAQRPIIPFAVGVACGHLFWPQQGT